MLVRILLAIVLIIISSSFSLAGCSGKKPSNGSNCNGNPDGGPEDPGPTPP